MNYCTACGTKIENEKALFCPNCGAKIVKVVSVSAEGFESYVQQTTSASTQSDLNVKQGMKWFKFLIYFALIFGGVTNIVLGILYISGDIFYILNRGVITAEEIYIYSGIGYGFKVLNVCYGIVLLSIGAFGFYVRSRLANYRKNAAMYISVLYGLGGGLYFLYSNLNSVLFDVNQEITISVLSPIVFAILMIFINYTYFTKRKHLFVE